MPQLYLRPNPADKEVSIEASGLEDEGTIAILSPEGKVMMSQPKNGREAKLNISRLPKGIYSVEVNDKNGKRLSEKLIVE
jgi:hypothetical protein